MSARLSAAQIRLSYPSASRAVVDNLSIDIADGQITTIIGPNGCGKSTLLRALGNLMRPESGAVVLDGELIHRRPTKDVARRLGLLHQQTGAPDGITVEDLARRGRYPHQGFLQPPSQKDIEATEQALAMAGVTDLREREVDSLSGGQRQRAWIAMALAQETDLLLLDEPTTFLDIAHQLEVIDLVRQLHGDGKTIVMVLHDINEAARVSNHLVAMLDGEIVRQGTPDKVIEPGLLAKLYGIDCDILQDASSGHPVCIPASADPTVGAEAPAARPGIEVRGLSTGYSKAARVSTDLGLDLPGGAITAIVGPNACGKSTLLRTGSRLLKSSGGTFRVAGSDTSSGNRRSLSRQLSILMQGPLPPEGFLVEDIVAAGRTPHQGFLRQWTLGDDEAVSAALDQCGIADLRYREIDTLSGGQRQRAWIAMALAQDTPFLFLDEPTTFLDIGYQIEVLDLVHRLNRADGRTVVMVLHDLNLAARYADHMVAMKDGDVVASGPPGKIVTTEVVRNVFGIDSRVVPDIRTGRPLVLPLNVASPLEGA